MLVLHSQYWLVVLNPQRSPLPLVTSSLHPFSRSLLLTDTMPVEKRQSKSARYRASLAENIEKNGFVVMPCSW